MKDTAEREYRSSPGKRNQLQFAVIEQFAPRFAPSAKLLYLGDPAYKTLFVELDELRRFGFSANKHGKLPDVVLYWPRKKWLYLVEVVMSHGPVSPKRYRELETIVSAGSVTRKYVSAFSNFEEYGRHIHGIAWDTSVWIAEVPDYLIHHDGKKFLRLRRPPKRKVR